MKLWEAIKELEENRNSVFECNGKRLRRYDTDRICMQTSCSEHDSPLFPFVDDNWQPVKPEPRKVEFMDAAKAFNCFKKVRCIEKLTGTCDFIRTKSITAFTDTNHLPLRAIQIFEGDWYILEDE